MLIDLIHQQVQFNNVWWRRNSLELGCENERLLAKSYGDPTRARVGVETDKIATKRFDN